VSVNISPSHIKDPIIIETVREALEKYQIPPNRLVIEITENLLIEGFKDVKEILKGLKALDVLISLDDFGTGYSSLNYLGQLIFDELKIDKIFIDQIETSTYSYMLIDNIVQLSKKFNLTVVAEGVETKTQCDALKELNCFIIQGYYFAKPEKL
jgi:EAL domain-containing protein (putative c-di-GMP-specific phosphodiesterase class I)